MALQPREFLGRRARIQADLAFSRVSIVVRGKDRDLCTEMLETLAIQVTDAIISARTDLPPPREVLRSPHSNRIDVNVDECRADAELPETERHLVCPETGLPVHSDLLLQRAGLLPAATPSEHLLHLLVRIHLQFVVEL